MDIAIEYVSHGLALVDIPRGKKGPTRGRWNKPENVITDPEGARTLVGNVGLAHAYSTPPTMALDIDDLPNARAWLAERDIDLDQLLGAEDAVQIKSGKVDHNKLIYRLPAGVVPMRTAQIKMPDCGGMILEFRCADANGLTVQDVLPPSIHPETGQPYRWGGKGSWREFPEIPARLLTVWRAERDARKTKYVRRPSGVVMTKEVDDTPRQRALLTAMLRLVSADCSYDLYRDIVWAVLSVGWRDAEDLARHWCQTAPNRFDEDNFNAVVTSYDVSRTPTLGTIVYHARQGGWDG